MSWYSVFFSVPNEPEDQLHTSILLAVNCTCHSGAKLQKNLMTILRLTNIVSQT